MSAALYAAKWRVWGDDVILPAMISLYDMLEAADGQLFGEPAAQIFTDFAIELGQVEEGCLFVAIKSDQGDGHVHLREAVERGALGLVCTEPPEFDTDGITVMIVRDAEQALMNWAQIVMRKFGTTVIGVTGSAGKSTAREIIAAVLGTRYNVYHKRGSFSGRLGLPLALGRLSAQHELAVLELSTARPGEMPQIIDIAQPLVGVVLNVDDSHLDRLGSVARIAEERTTLIEHLPEGGLAVLNYDSEPVRRMTDATRANVFSIGIDSFDADLMAYNIVVGRYKTGFDMRYGTERYVGRWVPLLGRHQMYAVMAAMAIGLSYQIDVEEGLRALQQVEPLPGRLHPLNGKDGCLLVDDTFSASPQSTEAALDWLDAVREDKGRLIFVMGDLDHLGNYAQRAHRQLGEHVARVADLFITQGNLASIAGRAALDYGMAHSQVRMTYSHRDAWSVLKDNLGPEDIVLVKGSRSARMDEVVRLLLHDEADAHLLAQPKPDEVQALTGQPTRPSWVEVDLTVMAENLRQVRELVAPGVAVLAKVPADGYGHGAVGSAMTAVLNGAAYLGAASLDEAITLRDAGVEAPILIQGYVPLWGIRDAIHYDLTVTLYELDFARLCNRIAADMERPLRMHVNVDSGMGQLGLATGQVMSFFRSLKVLRYLTVEGIYTELAAPQDQVYTQQQLQAFSGQIEPLVAAGMSFPYVHAADSEALLVVPDSHFSMVRAGCILHGLSPSPPLSLPPVFRPTLHWKTVVAQVKRMPRGSYIGAGMRYRTADEERIAVLPVGYADGLRAEPYPWREVLVRGQRVPVVGQVGMHETTINVSGAPAVRPGDEVVLLGRQQDEVITVEAAAGWLETSIFELLSTILARVPRL